ncbi:hypothetical protein N5C96_29240 [Delftia tsuruhatensis]|uniref:hypothetical protein n=1 Tax=Delftia tsuruhatensis TaxID=180282 RepID=UPI00244B76F9|nr:hypothetical protein [Delftia tsuruhatensis]MDH0777504.1 hypothetical protein [Delftia tsuruhatensis]MDH1824649.1 hypothetical protein [Delftia tsuruhatensis]
MTEQRQKISLHFAPAVLKRISNDPAQLSGWAGFIRDWYHKGDPDRIFGKDVSNHPMGGHSFAWHMHMVPSEREPDKGKILRWETANEPRHRVSDRLVIYSLDRASPYKYGFLFLDLIGDPGGHKICFEQTSSHALLQMWSNIGYAHQVGGKLPPGTITYSDSN